MMLIWLFLISAFALLFSVLLSYALHLQKVLKEGQDDFFTAKIDKYPIESEVVTNEENKRKSVEVLRWVLLLPAVIAAFILVLFLISQVTSRVVGIPSDQTQLTTWVGCSAAILAATWVWIAYFMAPRFKKQTAWIAFALGVLLLLGIAIDSGGLNIVWQVGFASAVLGGLISASIVQMKI